MSASTTDTTFAADTVLGPGRGPGPDRGETQGGRVAVELARGESLGRYLILGELGSGGMGKVYAAYDPELDRKLAIKLLHEAPGTVASQASSTGSSRLVREAQAMAKLSHRNVVSVHDVGVHAGRVFVAMEFVDGSTLDAWLEAEPRPWPELLARFIEAGRGLAAAHVAGLIHRDFKPANVLLGRDGRVRVADFGLARRTEDLSEPSGVADLREALGEALANPDAMSVRLTQTGAFVGTPAYMAPEQFMGAEVDARSDQFSFCVALWEALYNERPFAGDSPASIGFALMQGELREAPATTKVPSWLRRVVERGLAREPAARWPDMDALLEALSHNPASGRRRIAALVLGLGAVAAAAFGPRLWAEPEGPAPQLCTGADAAMAEVWSERQREAIHARHLELRAAPDSDREARLLARLDAWAGSWTDAWTETCAATRIHGQQSEELLDQRMLCLDRRKARFEAFVTGLATAEDEQLRKAAARVDNIGDVADCGDPEIMHARVPPPADPQDRADYERLLAAFDGVSALVTVGDYETARARLQPAYDAALATEHPTLKAEAHYTRGHFLTSVNEDAEAELELAYEAALTAGLFRTAGQATEDIATQLLPHHERQADADRWLRFGDALATYLDDDGLRYALLLTRGRLDRYRGEFESSLEHYSRSLDLAVAHFGPGSQRVGDSHFNLSSVYFDLGQLDEAMKHAAQAKAIWADSLGDNDPRTLVGLGAEGAFAWQLGEFDRAQRAFEDQIRRREAIFGPDDPSVATVYLNYGPMLSELGDPRGITILERALVIYEEEYGRDSVATAQCIANLAIAQLRMHPDEPDRALGLIDEAMEIMARHRDQSSVELLTGFAIRVELLRQMERWPRARAEADALVAMLQAADQDHGPLMVDILVELAYVEVAEGHALRALEHIDQADSIAANVHVGPRKIALRRLAHADALRALGREDDARTQLRLARESYRENRKANQEDWLWRSIEDESKSKAP